MTFENWVRTMISNQLSPKAQGIVIRFEEVAAGAIVGEPGVMTLLAHSK